MVKYNENSNKKYEIVGLTPLPNRFLLICIQAETNFHQRIYKTDIHRKNEANSVEQLYV